MRPQVVIVTLMLSLFHNTVSQEDVRVADEISITTESQTAATVAVTDHFSDRLSHQHHRRHNEDTKLKGFWRKKLIWKPKMVKTWQPKKIYVAVWKKIWGPAEIKEWVPIPKPPPGWDPHEGSPFYLNQAPH